MNLTGDTLKVLAPLVKKRDGLSKKIEALTTERQTIDDQINSLVNPEAAEA